MTGGVHRPAIDALAERGVFDGTECGQDMLCPGEEMKRWTMAVWLVRVLDEQEPPAVDESSFADVDEEHTQREGQHDCRRCVVCFEVGRRHEVQGHVPLHEVDAAPGVLDDAKEPERANDQDIAGHGPVCDVGQRDPAREREQVSLQ